ncbi:MAG: hypothetical protein Q8866_02515 [Candidatus Phytoplasma australasiaticum]|nr:hypothetical protein [Candidatus Phytoplasma australasiaticum]
MKERDSYRNGPYVPTHNCDSMPSTSRLEEMFDKLLKRANHQDETLKGMKADISSINQKIESHSVAIKELEQQFGEAFSQLNQYQKGTLQSYMV